MQTNTCKSSESIIGALFAAGIAFYIATQLQTFGRAGNDYATLGSLALMLFGLSRIVKALRAWDGARDKRRLKRRLESFSNKQGTAALGTLKDAHSFGLTTGLGPRVGRLDERALTCPCENGAFVFGPPGSGKSLLFTEILLTTRIGIGDE